MDKNSTVFGFIGTGNMGGALAQAARHTIEGSRILLAHRSPEKALALALNRLIEDRVLAERLGDEARRISERINEAAILEQWKEYIEEILG